MVLTLVQNADVALDCSLSRWVQIMTEDCHLRTLGQHEASAWCALNDSPYRAKALSELSELSTILGADRGGWEDTVLGQVTSR